MPSLKFIIGADASPFAQAMNTVASIGKNAGNQTASSLRQAAVELEKAMIKADGLGKSTKFYADQLAIVTGRLHEMASAQALATAEMDDFAEKQAQAANPRRGQGHIGLQGWLKTRNPAQLPLSRIEAERADDDRRQVEFNKRIAIAKERMRQDEIGKEEQSTARAEYIEARRANLVRIRNLRVSRERSSAAADSLPMQGPSAELFHAAQIEQVTRDNKARRLRRERAEERAGGMGSSRMGITSAMFVSVARDSAASLGSGAPISQIVAQQAPQVLQAMTMMGGNVFGKLAAKLMAPVMAAGAATGTGFLAGMRTSLAAMPLLVVGIAAASVAAIIGSFFIFQYRVNKLAKELSRDVQHVFDGGAIDQWLRRGRAVEKMHMDMAASARTIGEAYDSVASKAERLAEITKKQFEVQRELSKIAEDNELEGASTEQQKYQIREKFAAKKLALDKQERDQGVEDLKLKKAMLEAESNAKEAEFKRAIAEKQFEMPDETAEKKRQHKARVDAANEYLDVGKMKRIGDPETQFEKDNKQIAKLRSKIATENEYAVSRGQQNDPLKSTLAMMEALKKLEDIQSSHRENIVAAKKYDNDLANTEEKTRLNLEKRDAAKAASDKAVAIGKEIDPNNQTGLIARNKKADEDDQEANSLAGVGRLMKFRKSQEKEADAKFEDSVGTMTDAKKRKAIAAEVAKIRKSADFYKSVGDPDADMEAKRLEDKAVHLESKLKEKERGNGGYSMELTSDQKIGAFAAGPKLGLLDINKSMDAKLAQIVKNTTPGGGGNNPPLMLGGKRT